ncbi:hypothetical protein OG497_37660 [Streptomyces sp. NBC_01242]|uniref:hypothetical protein n=1 Tax=Streptomyces sp. NBC_01242 TaxID=2903795 RepID=UPI002251079D|nr:hypothetical protein [Streptomyces sp. NBC_01242]MCX4799585.1 hypothetical protein [Streptomyces sp. NBC_01242]
MDPNAAWGAILGAAFGYEMYGVFNKADGDTLSERVRDWFHTSTRPGKAVFVLAWLGLTAWFIPHIINGS